MNKMKKLASLLLALVMVFAMSATAFAESTEGPATGTITITPPAGVNANATNTYKIYKVFDAVGDGSTSISYKLVSGKNTAPAGFTVDTAGNVTYSGTGTDGLTDADIAAIAAYVTEADLVDTVSATGAAAVTSKALPNGYYYITTSTGTVVTIDSTNPNAVVRDKNTVPTLEKKITAANSVDADGKKALAQVGTDVEFSATITVGKGAKNYVFFDRMEEELSFKGVDSVVVKVGDVVVKNTNYIVAAGGDTDDFTFKVKFNDEYIKTLAVGTEITVVYSATITSDALQTDPAKNTAWLEYGDENSNYKTPVSETVTYNAKFTVTKKDGNEQPLAGAGFVIKNADGKYYKITNGVVTWVDNIEDATEHFSDENGNVQAFTGLANGTYTLVEKTVPAGYNKAADFDFTVAEHDYSTGNLEKATTVVNNAGTELPSTGGMGTTMLYVVGGLLVAGAVVVMISRKKAEEK